MCSKETGLRAQDFLTMLWEAVLHKFIRSRPTYRKRPNLDFPFLAKVLLFVCTCTSCMGICITSDNKEYVSPTQSEPWESNLTRVFMLGGMFGGGHKLTTFYLSL